jgi:hypothetical protein
MIPPPESFLGRMLVSWQPIEGRLRHAGVQARTRVAESGEKLAVELESQAHLALVEAWERHSCLDFTYVELPSQKSTLLFAGPCASNEELAARLARVENTLLSGSE